MNLLMSIDRWFAKRLVPEKPDDRPPIQQLEELVMWTAQAGHSRQKPKYYTHAHGQYADFKDFDTDRMVDDFSAEFPTIPKEEIRRVVMHGIYYWYLR